MPSTHKSSSSPLGLTTYTDDNTTTKIGEYVNITSNSGVKSLFSDNGNSFAYNGGEGSENISVNDIVSYCSLNPSMKLSYADFAYLTKLGVYPNNRLIIARRFESPVGDDLTAIKGGNTPISTLISWVKDNQDFLTLDYNEKWEDTQDGSFRKVLNEIGNDVMQGDNKGKDLGDFLKKGMNAIPLPGFTEGLQYEVFNALGMTKLDSTKLPLGNPNLIRESKRRSLVSKEETGSGLSAKFKITMEVEYEQKFISGIDPTTVYYDLIANALAFGTSESAFQFSSNSGIGENFRKWLDDLGSGNSNRVRSAIVTFVGALSTALSNIGNQIIGLFKDNDKPAKPDDKEAKAKAKRDSDLEKSSLKNFLKNIALGTLAGIVSKYKIKIVAIANAMTGTPSAPCHITIGNPKRPILSTGDMVCDTVELTLGKILAFNDLPSSIKLKITFTSARNLGLQEIFHKLSCGVGRTYQSSNNNFINKRRSFVEESFDPNQKDLEKAKATAKANTDAAAALVAQEKNQREIADKEALEKDRQERNRNNPQPK